MVNLNKNYFVGLLVLLIAITYIFLEIFDNHFLNISSSIIIIIFLFYSFIKVRGKIAILIYLLFFFSILLIIPSEHKLTLILEGVRSSLPLVAIFIMSPLLGIVVKSRNYIYSLNRFLSKFKNNAHFYYLSNISLTHCLGVVLNIGTIPINYYLSQVSNAKTNQLVAISLIRGFTTTVYWSPYFATMALISTYLNISWNNIAIYGIIFAVLSIFISYLVDWKIINAQSKHTKANKQNTVEQQPEIGEKSGSVAELVLLLIALMGISLLMDHLFIHNMVLTICLMSIVFPLVWCLSKKKMTVYYKEVNDHLTITLPNLSKELSLFLSAGLFSTTFVQSSWQTLFVDTLLNVLGKNYILFSFVISIIIVGLALFGIHAIITVSVLVSSIDPQLFQISNEYYGLLLIYSWAVANTIAPTTAVNNIISNLLKEPIKRISVD